MDENQANYKKIMKLNFFKKIWYSITKFEKYPEMAAFGIKDAILYFIKLLLIISIIFTIVVIYDISNIQEYEQKNLTLAQKTVAMLEKKNRYNNDNNNIININLNKDNPDLNKISDYNIVSIVFISIFIAFFISTFFYIILLSIFGIITCYTIKIKIEYKVIFSMSIYALTLSILLNLIYLIITTLTSFQIKYFDVMYVAVSYISLAAAIFLIKSNIIKTQIELMKIIEEGKEKIEEKIIEKRKPKEEKEEKEKKDEEQENNEEKENNDSEEQGSNA